MWLVVPEVVVYVVVIWHCLSRPLRMVGEQEQRDSVVGVVVMELRKDRRFRNGREWNAEAAD